MRLLDRLPRKIHPFINGLGYLGSYSISLNSVIPGLDPGISFHELSGRHQDFGLRSSCQFPPGDTRIKSGYDGKRIIVGRARAHHSSKGRMLAPMGSRSRYDEEVDDIARILLWIEQI